MSDNLRILDAQGLETYLRTTEAAGIHVPHHIVDSMALPTDASTETTLAAVLAKIIADPLTDVQLRASALSVNPTDHCLEVAAGTVSGSSALNKFGRNADIDIGAEDIWSQGGTWVPPTAARVHAIVSSSADDAAAGTGAQTVEVQGLDASFAVQTETVTLNGVTPVNTAGSYHIIHRMIVKTAGSGGYNVGTITATAATDATVTASIFPLTNQTLMAIWQVPAGKSFFMKRYYGSVNGSVAIHADLELWVKPFGETWQLKHIIGVDSEGSGIADMKFCPPMKFTEKSIIRLRATTATNNTDVSAGFDGIYR